MAAQLASCIWANHKTSGPMSLFSMLEMKALMLERGTPALSRLMKQLHHDFQISICEKNVVN